MCALSLQFRSAPRTGGRKLQTAEMALLKRYFILERNKIHPKKVDFIVSILV
jgi:hypothetical protein